MRAHHPFTSSLQNLLYAIVCLITTDEVVESESHLFLVLLSTPTQVLLLRNPSKHDASVTLRLSEAFELPQSFTSKTLRFVSVYDSSTQGSSLERVVLAKDEDGHAGDTVCGTAHDGCTLPTDRALVFLLGPLDVVLIHTNAGGER